MCKTKFPGISHFPGCVGTLLKPKGAQIRSKEKWIELGEKNNSYFLGLEKQRQVNKSINKLKDDKKV